MKYFFLAALVTLAACNMEDKNTPASGTANTATNNPEAVKDSNSFTSIQWLDSVNTELGKITEGQVIEVSWRFKKYRRQAAGRGKCAGWLRLYGGRKTYRAGGTRCRRHDQGKIRQQEPGTALQQDGYGNCQYKRQTGTLPDLQR